MRQKVISFLGAPLIFIILLLPFYFSAKNSFYLDFNFYGISFFLIFLWLYFLFKQNYYYLFFFLMVFLFSFPVGAKKIILPLYRIPLVAEIILNSGVGFVWDSFSFEINQVLIIFIGFLILSKTQIKNFLKNNKFFLGVSCLFLILLIISFLRSFFFLSHETIKIFFNWVGLFLYFLIFARVKNNEEIFNLIFEFLLLCGFAVSNLAIFQHFLGVTGFNDPLLIGSLYSRAQVVFPHPNILATYFGVVLIIAIIKYLTSGENKDFYYLLITFFVFAGLLATGSRGGILAFILTLTFLIIALAIKNISFRKIIILICVLFFSLLPFFLNGTICQRFFQIKWQNVEKFSTSKVLIPPGTPDLSITERLEIFQKTLREIVIKPFFGAGLWNWKHTMNLYLQIWVTMGIMNLVLFILILFRFFLVSVKLFKKNISQKNKNLILISFFVVAFFMFRALTDDLLHQLIFLGAFLGIPFSFSEE